MTDQRIEEIKKSQWDARMDGKVPNPSIDFLLSTIASLQREVSKLQDDRKKYMEQTESMASLAGAYNEELAQAQREVERLRGALGEIKPVLREAHFEWCCRVIECALTDTGGERE